MKFFTAVLLIGLVDWSLQQNLPGETPAKTVAQGSKLIGNMEDDCRIAITEHIKQELNASLTYLAMGAHFLTVSHYRPGVAQFFIESASEERAHAKGLIEYIQMRGYSVNVANTKTQVLAPKIPESSCDMEKALTDALEKEEFIRDEFVKIIKKCESKENDYHASDKLTGVYLEEQHESIRKIAGHLRTLGKMKAQLGSFGEIMFDRTLIA